MHYSYLPSDAPLLCNQKPFFFSPHLPMFSALEKIITTLKQTLIVINSLGKDGTSWLSLLSMVESWRKYGTNTI